MYSRPQFLVLVLAFNVLSLAQSRPKEDDPVSLLTQARNAQQAEDCDKAVKLFKAVLSLIPQDPIAQKGLEDCNALSERKRLPYYIEQINAFYSRGDINAAYQYLEMALKADPTSHDFSSYVKALAPTNSSEAQRWLSLILSYGGITAAFDDYSVRVIHDAMSLLPDRIAFDSAVSSIRYIEPDHPFWNRPQKSNITYSFWYCPPDEYDTMLKNAYIQLDDVTYQANRGALFCDFWGNDSTVGDVLMRGISAAPGSHRIKVYVEYKKKTGHSAWSGTKYEWTRDILIEQSLFVRAGFTYRLLYNASFVGIKEELDTLWQPVISLDGRLWAKARTQVSNQ